MVTVLALDQLPSSNESVVGRILPSPSSLLLNAMLTGPRGCDNSATVNVALPPSSDVWRFGAATILYPEWSLSTVTNGRPTPNLPSYPRSTLLPLLSTMLYC